MFSDFSMSISLQVDDIIQAAQCSLVQNIYFGLQKIGSLCQKNRRKIGNYRPKMAFL